MFQGARFFTAEDKGMDGCQKKTRLMPSRPVVGCSQQFDLNYTFLPLPRTLRHCCVAEGCIPRPTHHQAWTHALLWLVEREWRPEQQLCMAGLVSVLYWATRTAILREEVVLQLQTWNKYSEQGHRQICLRWKTTEKLMLVVEITEMWRLFVTAAKQTQGS